MPELPEVETVRRGVERWLRGRAVTAVTLRRHDLRWPIPVARVRALRHRTCTAVDRRSKYLLLRFDGLHQPVAVVHLGMSGRLFVDSAEVEPEYELHEHWRMAFDERRLRFVDARRFGALDVVPAAELPRHKLLAELGPEPLGDDFDGELLFRRSRRRKAPIKTFLMDAHNVVGVGNIYACEVCHRAAVRPRRAIGSLTRESCDRLADAIRSVLREAIEQGGTTLRDYISADRDTGYFQQSLKVYGRGGQPCHDCGAQIKRIVTSGRSTYYCPRCQT